MPQPGRVAHVVFTRVPVADRSLGKSAGAIWMALEVVPGALGRPSGSGVMTFTPSMVYLLPRYGELGAFIGACGYPGFGRPAAS
jgi:hypothetical protein